MEPKGIETDLPQTNLEAVIPEEQKVLLEVNSDRYGIHQQMEKLLLEINTDDVDWSQTLENLHSRAMSDFSYYNTHKRGADAIGVYCGLYTQVASDHADVTRGSIDRLYLTGAGTHPGGNITGAPGYNAAQVVIRDLGMEVWWNPPDPRKVWAELD